MLAHKYLMLPYDDVLLFCACIFDIMLHSFNDHTAFWSLHDLKMRSDLPTDEKFGILRWK